MAKGERRRERKSGEGKGEKASEGEIRWRRVYRCSYECRVHRAVGRREAGSPRPPRAPGPVSQPVSHPHDTALTGPVTVIPPPRPQLVVFAVVCVCVCVCGRAKPRVLFSLRASLSTRSFWAGVNAWDTRR